MNTIFNLLKFTHMQELNIVELESRVELAAAAAAIDITINC
ncbi:hypothetical protein [Chitinophaga sp.]